MLIFSIDSPISMLAKQVRGVQASQILKKAHYRCTHVLQGWIEDLVPDNLSLHVKRWDSRVIIRCDEQPPESCEIPLLITIKSSQLNIIH